MLYNANILLSSFFQALIFYKWETWVLKFMNPDVRETFIVALVAESYYLDGSSLWHITRDWLGEVKVHTNVHFWTLIVGNARYRDLNSESPVSLSSFVHREAGYRSNSNKRTWCATRSRTWWNSVTKRCMAGLTARMHQTQWWCSTHQFIDRVRFPRKIQIRTSGSETRCEYSEVLLTSHVTTFPRIMGVFIDIVSLLT